MTNLQKDKMDTFTIRTDSLTEENNLADYEAYFMIYLENGDIKFKAGHQEDFIDDLSMLITALTTPEMQLDIIESLPELLPTGEIIAANVYEGMDYEEDDFINDLEESVLIQPCNLFQEHHHE